MNLNSWESEPKKFDTSISLLDRLVVNSHESDWEQFLQIYDPFIKSQLHRCGISPSETDDLSQESLAKIIESINGFSHNGRKGAFRKWLKSIVVQRVLRFYRNRGHKPQLIGDRIDQTVDESWQTELDRNWDREHDQYVLNKFIELIRPSFTESTWMAFELQAINKMPPQQAAEQIGISVNAVLIGKSRVLTRLRRLSSQIVDQS